MGEANVYFINDPTGGPWSGLKVYDPALARIDAVVVQDKSSSMEFGTLCYGCWEAEAGIQYPGGSIYPLHWSDTTIENADHCANDCTTYITRTIGAIDYRLSDCHYYNPDHEDYYTVIEAEHYSYHNIDYHRSFYQPYKSYWVLQRNTYNEDEGAFGDAYISHHPYVDEYMKEGGPGWEHPAPGAISTMGKFAAGNGPTGRTCKDVGPGKWAFDDGGGPVIAGDKGDIDGNLTYTPNSGDFYDFIRGIGWYDQEAYKLEPRYDADVGLRVTPSPRRHPLSSLPVACSPTLFV